MRKSIVSYLILFTVILISFPLTSCFSTPSAYVATESESTAHTESTTSTDTTATLENTDESVAFSFDEYFDSSEVREYNMVIERDVSVSNNFRMKYCVTVPRDITEEELKSTLVSILKDKSTSNPAIDEIDVAAWYDEAAVEKTPCLAYVWWSPNGDWGSAHGEIAEKNDRQSYLVVFELKNEIKPEEVKYGLTEQERKQVFYDLVALQDKISFDDSDYDEKMDQANETIASQYGLTAEEVEDIGFEGVFNSWPMPDLE